MSEPYKHICRSEECGCDASPDTTRTCRSADSWSPPNTQLHAVSFACMKWKKLQKCANRQKNILVCFQQQWREFRWKELKLKGTKCFTSWPQSGVQVCSGFVLEKAPSVMMIPNQSTHRHVLQVSEETRVIPWPLPDSKSSRAFCWPNQPWQCGCASIMAMSLWKKCSHTTTASAWWSFVQTLQLLFLLWVTNLF